VFVGYETLLCGVYDAVLLFNEGNAGKVKVLKKLGIEPGANMVKCCAEIDNIRVRKADDVSEFISKKARQQARNVKRAREDADDPDDPEYETGMFFGQCSGM
jgi:hypothetical protein